MPDPICFDYFEIRPCVEAEGSTVSFMGEPQYCERRGDKVCTPAGALAEAEAYNAAAKGGGVFWTLYGREDGIATAIGDFKSFDAAFGVMNAILAPMAKARDLIVRHGAEAIPANGWPERPAYRKAADDLDDFINQSSMDDRL